MLANPEYIAATSGKILDSIAQKFRGKVSIFISLLFLFCFCYCYCYPPSYRFSLIIFPHFHCFRKKKEKVKKNAENEARKVSSSIVKFV